MKPSYKSIVSEALQKGWVSSPSPQVGTSNSINVQRYRQRLYAAGLTSRGTARKKRAGIPTAIIAAAKRDGVGVTAIYNRIKRKGKLTL